MWKKDQLQTGRACTIVGLVTNVFLTTLKLAVGLLYGSQALFADGLNSLSDVVVSTVVYLAYKISRLPADKDHHYGHGNAETIAGLIVSTGVIAVGATISYHAIHVLRTGVQETPGRPALYAAALSILIKEFLYRYTTSVAEEEHSPSLKATAKDYRSDVLASGAALFGIFGARNLGYPYLDPFAGLLIGVLIIRMGISLIAENVHFLMAGAPTSGISEDVLATVRRFDEVRGVPRLRVQRLGAKYVVNLDIAVDGTMTVEEGHSIAEQVRDLCLAEHKHLYDVIVHVDPYRG
jgi:cation diffusion facilitator family transporter